MYNKIKKIEFILENCEAVAVDIFEKNYMTRIITTRISESINTQANSFWLDKKTNFLEIQLENELRETFYFVNEFPEKGKSKWTAWERLKLNDVTSINFIFEDNTELQLYVPWGNKDFVNTKMKIEENKQSKYYLDCYTYIIFDNRNKIKKFFDFLMRKI